MGESEARMVTKKMIEELIGLVDDYWRAHGMDNPVAIRYDYELQIGCIMMKPIELPSPIAFSYIINMISEVQIHEFQENLKKLEEQQHREKYINEKMKE